MFIICGRTSFYVVDKEDGFANVKTAGTKHDLVEVQDLLYKSYKYVLDNIDELLEKDFIQQFIETGISIYKMDIPPLFINPLYSEEETLFEYVNSKFRLFGYVFVKPVDVVGCYVERTCGV